MGALGEGLSRYHKQGFCSFHTPGHKGRQEFFNGFDFPGFDLTELPGLDMLHSPNGIIAEAQKQAADVFGAEETFFLVNGGTVGNHVMFLTLEGAATQRVMVERSSHRSVMSGLVLSGLRPDYLTPTVHPDFNLPLGLDVEHCSVPWGGIAGLHVTYPSYYGSVFDLKQLLDERIRLGFGTPILVDQAHGSHYLSSLFPPSALNLGADLVLQSSHKTLSALTQAAMLHVQGLRISRSRLKQTLELMQSSSPSYLFLASLERASELALDLSRWTVLQEEVEQLYRHVGELFRILSPKDAGTYGISQVDWTKILINTGPLGIPAPRCVDYLRETFGIEPELWDDENILFMLGIGNTPEDVRLLTKGLKQLAHFAVHGGFTQLSERLQPQGMSREQTHWPVQVLSPREAYFARKRQIPLQESIGHVIGETISPYPPGIPLIVMGEQMDHEWLERLMTAGEGRWQGWDGFQSKMIWVVEEG